MAKKQEVVDTWGRLAERVNSNALAIKSPQHCTGKPAVVAAAVESDEAAAAAGQRIGAIPQGLGVVRGATAELPAGINTPELDDVD